MALASVGIEGATTMQYSAIVESDHLALVESEFDLMARIVQQLPEPAIGGVPGINLVQR